MPSAVLSVVHVFPYLILTQSHWGDIIIILILLKNIRKHACPGSPSWGWLGWSSIPGATWLSVCALKPVSGLPPSPPRMRATSLPVSAFPVPLGWSSQPLLSRCLHGILRGGLGAFGAVAPKADPSAPGDPCSAGLGGRPCQVLGAQCPHSLSVFCSWRV